MRTLLLLQLDDYDMVGFIPMDLSNEDSLDVVLQHVDHAMQYGEDLEPKGTVPYLVGVCVCFSLPHPHPYPCAIEPRGEDDGEGASGEGGEERIASSASAGGGGGGEWG
jgi:hypothetical protein